MFAWQQDQKCIRKLETKGGLHNYVNIYLYTGCQDDRYKISFYLEICYLHGRLVWNITKKISYGIFLPTIHLSRFQCCNPVSTTHIQTIVELCTLVMTNFVDYNRRITLYAGFQLLKTCF